MAETVSDLLQNPVYQPGEVSYAAGQQPSRFNPKQLTSLGIGCAVVLVLGILAFYFTALALNPDRNTPGVIVSQTQTEEALSSPTTQPSTATTSPTRLPPTNTYPPPTSTAEAIILPSATLPPDESPPTLTPVPNSPPPPNRLGDLFVLYYDKTSFYIKNASGEDRSVYPLAFERLDRNDRPTNRLEGWYWGNIYSKFRANYCMVLEILTTDEHLSPPECKNRYLVIRTPTTDSDLIFWTKEKNYREFRVLWNDEEVGRCKIDEKTCEVFLP